MVVWRIIKVTIFGGHLVYQGPEQNDNPEKLSTMWKSHSEGCTIWGFVVCRHSAGVKICHKHHEVSFLDKGLMLGPTKELRLSCSLRKIGFRGLGLGSWGLGFRGSGRGIGFSL